MEKKLLLYTIMRIEIYILTSTDMHSMLKYVHPNDAYSS
jgi:hypothetical protein